MTNDAKTEYGSGDVHLCLSCWCSERMCRLTIEEYKTYVQYTFFVQESTVFRRLRKQNQMAKMKVGSCGIFPLIRVSFRRASSSDSEENLHECS